MPCRLRSVWKSTLAETPYLLRGTLRCLGGMMEDVDRLRGWPVTLTEGPVGLRPLRLRDVRVWRESRLRNAELAPPLGAEQPRDPPVQDRPRPLHLDGRDPPQGGQAGARAALGRHLRGRLRRAAHRGRHRLGFGQVGPDRLLGGRRPGGARDHPHRRGHGGGPLLLHHRAAPRRGRTSARKIMRAAEWSKSSVSGRKASGVGICTSTAPGAITSVTRSRSRTRHEGCWCGGGEPVNRPPTVELPTKRFEDLATHRIECSSNSDTRSYGA